MSENLISKLKSSLLELRKNHKQKKIDKAFKREMHIYEETKLDLRTIGFSEDIKYHISERSKNILFLLQNTSLDFSISRQFLIDLDNGLSPSEKKEFIEIIKSQVNIKFNEEDIKILRLDWQNDDLLPAQKIGTKPSRISMSVEKH